MQGGNQGMTPEQWQAYQAMQQAGAAPTGAVPGAVPDPWQAYAAMQQTGAMPVLTPEQMQAYAAMQQTGAMPVLTPEQMQAYAAMQQTGAMPVLTPEQMQAYAAMQQTGAMPTLTPEQMQAYAAMQQTGAMPVLTPEQMQAYAAMQQTGAMPTGAVPGAVPDPWQAYAAMQQTGAMPTLTPEQWQAYQAMQQTGALQPPPRTRKPKRSKKPRSPRKRLSPVARLFRALVVVGAVVAAVWLILANSNTRPTTATVQRGVIGNTFKGDALIVRNETAYDDEGVMSIDYVAQEGSVVYRGDVVCYVYSTGYSTKEMDALQDYRDQIKEYQRTLLKTETAYDQRMQRLETEVVERGLEVRSLVQGARGNLINQEKILDTAIDARQKYFRSKYSDDMRLNRLFDDESTQLQRIDGWIKQKAAAQESIISFYTDGFEYALTPTTYENYSPAEVRSMIGGMVPERSLVSRGRTDIYRLVKKTNYVVLLLIKDNTWNPVVDTTYKLMLEQFSNTTVNATVLSFTRASGELLVRLAVIGDVSPVLYMRTCQAELGEYVDALMVPKEAVFEYNGVLGVALPPKQAGENPTFIPVTVVQQDGDTMYISPMQTGTLNEGNTVLLYY